MAEITTCKVMNSVDKKNMTISTKWNTDDLQVLILRDGMEPLKGQIKVKDITDRAKNFSKTPEEYLEEVKRELSGKGEDIEFTLKENTLQWKRKFWNRGSIECESVNNIIDFSQLIANIIMRCVDLEESTSKLKSENDTLKSRTMETNKVLNDMVELKNNLENELYKNFIILLNSKKKKIRELEEKLRSPHPIYDESTDDSEIEYNNTENNLNSVKAKPATLSNEKKSENNSSCNSIFLNITKAIESNCDTLNDSDDSLVLKFSLSPNSENFKNINKTNPKDSDDDLFSD